MMTDDQRRTYIEKMVHKVWWKERGMTVLIRSEKGTKYDEWAVIVFDATIPLPEASGERVLAAGGRIPAFVTERLLMLAPELLEVIYENLRYEVDQEEMRLQERMDAEGWTLVYRADEE